MSWNGDTGLANNLSWSTGFKTANREFAHKLGSRYKYLLLTEFEGRIVSYGPSFFLLDLWPKREARES